MRKIISILAIALGLSVGSVYAQMSDSQVIEYTKSAVASGKSQNQIAKELLARGVTAEQAERIKNNYESRQETSTASTAAAVDNTLSTRGERSVSRTSEDVGEHNMAETVFASSEGKTSTIYGRNVFSSRALSFEPNLNAATPDTYVLGPGDEIVIDIWGFNETSFNRTISPEGRITIPQVGPVQLSGLTIAEASKKLKKVLANKYAGLGGDSSSISVTLGNIRTIQVNIMGEVSTPGTYRLSSFTTLFNALYRAGGINPSGTLRNIELIRNGEKIESVDVYQFLFDGKTGSDIRLEEGDMIMVSTYSRLVTIAGKVKRPMTYELVEGETLEGLVNYAGGFVSDSYTDNVSVIRQTGAEKEIYTVNADQFATYRMEDGDEVSVGATLDRFSNRIEIRGYVFRPGQYQLGDEIATLKQLVSKAGGLTEEAFTNRALLLREKADLSVETISIDLGGILNGYAEDVLLKKNDVVVISGIHELNDRGSLTINGMVARPGTFVFSDNTTIEDLILRAGGLIEGASTVRVDIARRINNPESLTPTDTLGVTFSFPIKDGFAIDGGENFILEPYDVVSVRMSPGFRTQTYVTIDGAVAFPGTYLLLNKNETISDLVERAGGLTSQAYAKGARLVRVSRTDYTSVISRVVTQNMTSDSVNVGEITSSRNYMVALDLDKALKSPHTDVDTRLVAGDAIFIPEVENTVRILGDVMFPNAVTYEQGKRIRHYVNAAGGFSSNAKKSKAYVIYANGSAARKNARIEPGCTIIVPAKPEKKPMETANIAAITSASTSMLSLVALISNLFMP